MRRLRERSHPSGAVTYGDGEPLDGATPHDRWRAGLEHRDPGLTVDCKAADPDGYGWGYVLADLRRGAEHVRSPGKAHACLDCHGDTRTDPHVC
jgi:hypothetical protein